MKDSDIILAIKRGDKSALEEVYSKNRKAFIRWMSSRFKVSEEAGSDVYHQCILVFYENIVNGKLEILKCSIRTYLLAIGKNKVFEMQRLEHKKSVLIGEDIPDLNQPDHEKQTDQLIKLSQKALQILGDPCKTLLELFYYHKRSMQEITVQLGYKNENSTKNQKYKCLIKLRKLFQQEVLQGKLTINEAY